MKSPENSRYITLYEAAADMGVTFTKEWAPESKFVAVNGLNFHYLEWGDQAKPTIILLHGFAQQAHSWDFVALSFCDRYRVIVLDQRGHGDSSWSKDGDYSLDAFQNDLELIVEKLALKTFILMGLSMGGRNAIMYAANNPNKVSALVIVDASPENMEKGAANIRNFVEQDDQVGSLEEFVERIHRFNPRRDPIHIRSSIVNNVKQLENGKWTWKYDKLLRNHGLPSSAQDSRITDKLWRSVETIICPTLVVTGAKSDIVSKQTVRRMIRRLANGHESIVNDAGHLVMGDNPSGFEKAVSTFIANLT